MNWKIIIGHKCQAICFLIWWWIVCIWLRTRQHHFKKQLNKFLGVLQAFVSVTITLYNKATWFWMSWKAHAQTGGANQRWQASFLVRFSQFRTDCCTQFSFINCTSFLRAGLTWPRLKRICPRIKVRNGGIVCLYCWLSVESAVKTRSENVTPTS